MNKKNIKILLSEFFRYGVVGGIAFVADLGSLYLFKEYIFTDPRLGIYLATAIGFIIGLIVNYSLSLKFVFIQSKDQGKGRDLKSFVIFAIIGIIGLGLTELGMYIGCELLKKPIYNFLTLIGNSLGISLAKQGYLFVKCVVTALVLVWNYAGRKIIIFR